MTKTKSKSALLASGLSLVLCFAMLLGTTFAWFSDSVSNKGNKITAGNLKIGFYVSDTNATLPAIGGSNADWTDLKLNADPIFTMGTADAPAQPGDKLTKYIAIRNEGNIALQYYLDFLVNDGGLGDAVTFAFKEIHPNTNNAKTVTGSQLADQKINGSSKAKNEYVIYQMDLTFLESAGNTYQGGTFEVDMNLTATQDKDSAREALIKATDATAFKDVKANSTIVLQKNITTTETIEITNFANIDLNGYTLTCKDFSIAKDNALGTIDISNGKIIATDGNIKASAAMGSVNITNVNGTVSENGKVYLNGSMNTVNIFGGSTFNVPITIPANTKVVVAKDVLTPVSFKVVGGNVLIENNGVIGTIDATESGTEVEVSGNAPGSVTGNVDVSEATGWDGITNTEVTPIGNVYTVNTASELAWIAKQTNSVSNAFSKKSVVLGKDINLNDKAWTPIGTNENAFTGTFNGMNHTISNLLVTDQSVIGPGTKDNAGFAGLFGVAKGTVVENININNVAINIAAKRYVRAGAIGGMIFTGRIENCHVSGSVNIYSVNNHAVGGINGYGYVDILNCSVITTGGIIRGTNAFTGGITGFLGEGPHKIVGCQVKGVEIMSGFMATGICGSVQYEANLIKDCIVEDSILTGLSSGIEDTSEIAHLNPKGTIENCQFINSIRR